MQLFLLHHTSDFAGWKEHFDKDAEDRAQAGLTTLQVWQGDGIAAALFTINDRTKAETFLQTQDKLLRDRAGVTSHDHHFLAPA